MIYQESFDLKIKAAECHQSQFKKYKEAGFDVSENLTYIESNFRGIQENCKYYEGFQVIKQVESMIVTNPEFGIELALVVPYASLYITR